jgi:dihydrolipoamide dehydrogenase
MTNIEKFDIAIIGSGSAGYVAAIRGADLGKKVLIIEKGELGGTCLNRGCIPTKALLHSAEIYSHFNNSEEIGIKAENISYDLNVIQKRKNDIINKLATGIDLLLKSRKIVLKKGCAKIVDEHIIEINHEGNIERINAENIIIATGSEPLMPPCFKFDGKNIITSKEALEVKEIPKDILIIGSGAIGVEFAIFFSSFGAKVTLVEMMPQIIPALRDKKMAKLIQRILSKKGIDVITGTKVENIEIKEDGRVFSTLSSGKTIQNEKVLVSIGRKLNSEGIGLEDVGVKVENGRIIVNDKMQTNIPNIFAIGDVIGGLLLAHKAQREGIVAAEVISGLNTKMDYRVVPSAIFSSPEISAVGLTEEEAKEKGIEIITGEIPFASNGKALTMNETEGLVKVVAKKDTKEIIGAQIVGPDASVLIAELALSVEKNLTLMDVANTIHTHPTLPEVIMEAAKAALGEAIHKAKR